MFRFWIVCNFLARVYVLRVTSQGSVCKCVCVRPVCSLINFRSCIGYFFWGLTTSTCSDLCWGDISRVRGGFSLYFVWLGAPVGEGV